ncbi:hypothetical protein [Streptomyces sp. NPDC093105]|uniref:hypothetical protein n=1 Tax=Streptomyces sp. NPDC093105 TaxID=3366029 RepID=UPI003813E0A9
MHPLAPFRQLAQVALVGPAGAPPALAAIRFLALLPAGWEATLTGCDETAALLRLSAPAATTAAEATTALAALLADPALAGWRLTLPDDGMPEGRHPHDAGTAPRAGRPG